MKIDGRQIAGEILTSLRIRVNQLKKARGITPRLAVVLVGNNPASLIYIRQKQKAAEKIGVQFSLHHFDQTPTPEKITLYIKKLAAEPGVHGLITQRPIPAPLSTDDLTRLVPPTKDVDGFLANSPFDPPVALAVIKILRSIFTQLKKEKPQSSLNDFTADFLSRLRTKRIVIIGRGETAGKPIAQLFVKHSLPFEVIHTRTVNRVELLQKADIIVSSVGKPNVVQTFELNKGVIMVSIGLHNQNGKLIGDYDESKINTIASFYTPTPGGTGPVNVASLMQNVVTAAYNQTQL